MEQRIQEAEERAQLAERRLAGSKQREREADRRAQSSDERARLAEGRLEAERREHAEVSAMELEELMKRFILIIGIHCITQYSILKCKYRWRGEKKREDVGNLSVSFTQRPSGW